MDEWWNGTQRTSVLADLGPLPEVVESDSETVWQTFLRLQAHEKEAGFSETSPSRQAGPYLPGQACTVDDVMLEVRRSNRICPVEPQWIRLCSLLRDAAGLEPPAAICGADARTTPKLTKRIRIRDQVEWAAQHGALHLLAAFIAEIPEDQWVHLGQ